MEDENDSIRSFLDEQGIPIDEDGLLIISREISINSPSISRINDKVVTLTILNKISHRLVDIFAQHEHQSLLNTSNHKTIIDSFGIINIEICWMKLHPSTKAIRKIDSC